MTGKDAVRLDLLQLGHEVEHCQCCQRMQGSARIFSQASGSLTPSAMFIGEAPGRLGADTSAIPFHGDVAGHNFETLLELAGIERGSVFVTNAVLCNPRDSKGNNATPRREEVRNCNAFLKRQIDRLNPHLVVSLGASALQALSLIEEHSIQLSAEVRTKIRWYNRDLIPLYHPGRRALIHRNFETQVADYEFVSQSLPKSLQPDTGIDPYRLVRGILNCVERPLSYFALHKLYYLSEVTAMRKLGRRLTRAYIVRQSDGPYVTNLHIAKLAKHVTDLNIIRQGGTLYLSLASSSRQVQLFGSVDIEQDELANIVHSVLGKYGGRTDAELKTAAYLTRPMKQILREEMRAGKVLNTPICL